MAKPVKWVLFVEDDRELRELVTAFLEFQLGDGVKVVPVENGAEASAKVRFQAYDCIVTDLQMPKKEGRAFIETVHQSPLNDKTPIIVFTGFPDRELLARFPMCILLEKPAVPQTMLELVENQLRLGPVDRRVGANTLNSVLECTQLLLKNLFGQMGQPTEPRAKRKGDTFTAPYVRYFHFKADAQTAAFAFGFSSELLIAMDRKLFKAEDLHPPDKVAMAATNAILNNTTRNLGFKSVSVTKSIVLTPEDSEQPKELLDGKGIIMPITTEFGELQILAMA